MEQKIVNVVFKALDDGWSVKKSSNDTKTFEFVKKQSLGDDYKGLVVFLGGGNIDEDICNNVQKHLELKSSVKEEIKKGKRSISTPIDILRRKCT